MLTINNNNNGNKQSFTSTFRLKNPNKYTKEFIDGVLKEGEKITEGTFFNSARSLFGKTDEATSLSCQEITRGEFKAKRDVFYTKTERPFEHIETPSASQRQMPSQEEMNQLYRTASPTSKEINYNSTLPYDKVTVSVPDEKDSVIKQLLDSVGIKYTAKKLPSEKSVKYVLINSDELTKKGGGLWKVKIINHFREFQQGEIITDFLDGVAQPFRILMARAGKGESGKNQVSELELRVPKRLMPELRAYLKKEGLVATISDNPKYLNYA